jgi:hypothetical protein
MNCKEYGRKQSLFIILSEENNKSISGQLAPVPSTKLCTSQMRSRNANRPTATLQLCAHELTQLNYDNFYMSISCRLEIIYLFFFNCRTNTKYNQITTKKLKPYVNYPVAPVIKRYASQHNARISTYENLKRSIKYKEGTSGDE